MFSDEVRHYCRNERCRMKLPAPVDSDRRAFCCRGCWEQFYRTRCLVCERPITPKPESKGGKPKRFCFRPACSSEFQRFRPRFEYRRPGSAKPVSLLSTNAANTGIRSGVRAWGPPLSDSQLKCALLDWPKAGKRTMAPVEAKGVLFGPDTPPLNILGGYRFPGTPDVKR